MAHDHGHAHDHLHDHHPHDPAAVPQPHRPGALVSARKLAFERHGRAILHDIDIDVALREIVTIIGPNGAGKTTLVRLLLGLETPTAGDLARASDLIVGYVPQRFDLDRAIPMTVLRFLLLARPVDRQTITTVLDEVGAPDLIERQVAELSGGELQRVLIARALLRSPNLLVLDEPVRGVDHQGAGDLYALISRLRAERGMSVLMVSHDLHVVMAQSDRVVCINQHVCCSGVPEAVAEHPEYARLFGPHAAASFAIYRHHHDHRHDLTGAPTAPARSSETRP
jgi:zinc transport system ATP-binding protein